MLVICIGEIKIMEIRALRTVLDMDTIEYNYHCCNNPCSIESLYMAFK